MEKITPANLIAHCKHLQHAFSSYITNPCALNQPKKHLGLQQQQKVIANYKAFT